MKTIFIFPILLLIICVSEHQSAVLEDCDEDDSGPSPRISKLQTQQKNDKIPARHPVKPKESFNRPPRPQQQDLLQKRQYMPSIRRAIKLLHASPQKAQKRRILPPKRPFQRRQSRPLLWPPKQNSMNLVIKPIMKKTLDPPTKVKLSDYYPVYPYNKQKRIKLIPTFDEYETYPETDFVHEIMIPEPRAYDYVEMENQPGFDAPCDQNDESEYKDLSTEIQAREMEKLNEKENEVTSPEPEVTTVKEVETTTPVAVIETTPSIEIRSANIPIGNTPEPVTNIMEMLIRGILALITCLKTKAPMLDEILTNALNSCKSLSS